MPADSIEASLAPELETKPFERDVCARTGAVVQRRRYDPTLWLWVPAGTCRLEAMRTTMCEF